MNDPQPMNTEHCATMRTGMGGPVVIEINGNSNLEHGVADAKGGANAGFPHARAPAHG
jgi:hypothetical protein